MDFQSIVYLVKIFENNQNRERADQVALQS